jgi:hypothetical protein
MNLIKSKRRVADHGEVFTPRWLVEKMLDLVKGETERIDSRFLEPACGSGNFLVPVLQRKLAAVEIKFGKTEFEHPTSLLPHRFSLGPTSRTHPLGRRDAERGTIVVAGTNSLTQQR